MGWAVCSSLRAKQIFMSVQYAFNGHIAISLLDIDSYKLAAEFFGELAGCSNSHKGIEHGTMLRAAG